MNTLSLPMQSAMMTLEQRRSATAWRFAQEGVARSDQYKDLAKAAPALIMNNGLLQTLAFLRTRASCTTRTWPATCAAG